MSLFVPLSLFLSSFYSIHMWTEIVLRGAQLGLCNRCCYPTCFFHPPSTDHNNLLHVTLNFLSYQWVLGLWVHYDSSCLIRQARITTSSLSCKVQYTITHSKRSAYILFAYTECVYWSRNNMWKQSRMKNMSHQIEVLVSDWLYPTCSLLSPDQTDRIAAADDNMTAETETSFMSATSESRRKWDLNPREEYTTRKDKTISRKGMKKGCNMKCKMQCHDRIR